MTIDSREALQELRLGDWDRFARDCGLAAPFVRRRVGTLCDLAREQCENTAADLSQPGFDDAALRGFAARIDDRASRLAATVRP